MIVEKIKPDKIRFLDYTLRTDKDVIHTIELSDENSVEHFMTWYDTSDTDWESIANIQPHNDAVFHRERPKWAWFQKRFFGMDGVKLRKHYHIFCDNQPGWNEVERLLFLLEGRIRPRFAKAIRKYFGKEV